MTSRHQTYRGRRRGLVLVVFAFVILLLLVACGGNAESTEAEATEEVQATTEPATSGRQVPTMPAARFAAPTTMIDATRVAQSAATPEAAEVSIEFGEQVYSRLCADCHGEALEGVSGSAEPIDAYESDEGSLTDLLRTGGGFGPDHIFGLDKVSPQGIASLHAYLQSIDEGE
jgi:mono/diheme cytochrome c family protein